MTPASYHQGDINFYPLEAFGKSSADVDRRRRLRADANHLLIQEGEITGHHHGCWFVPRPTMLHDGALARSFADASPQIVTAQLFDDPVLLASLNLDAGSPVIGFLVADSVVTIRHASVDGKSTGEHDDVKLLPGGYLVTGKREWTADDERRVRD